MQSTVRLVLTVLAINFSILITNAQIAVNSSGNNPDASAMLDVSSSDKGILIPRMTTAERTAISDPATGLMVYDSDENSFWYYNGTAWSEVGNDVFASENGVTHNINNSDNFIIGVDSINYNSGSELKMFYDKSQGAFRTGRVNNTNWNEDSLGLYSFATGNNTLATGSTSAAFGYLTTASGTHSFAGGNQSEATANLAFAFGREVYAPSYGEVAFGLYGTSYTANETLAFDENDRLFSLGNGTANNNRSDAMVIYKSGNTEINGQLTVSDTVNLSSALMVNGIDLANTAFTSENGLTSATNSSDDFLIGASMDAGSNSGEVKLFLDQGKAAFRAGTVNSTNWDQGNLGYYSTAIGFGNLASGAGSVALGYGTSASGASTTALGYQSTASGNYSSTFGAFTNSQGNNATSFGYATNAYGHYSTTFGFNTYAPSYLETVIGSYNTNYSGNRSSFDSDDRLFVIGNGTGSSACSDAMIVYKSGNTEINGALHITDAPINQDFVLTIENTVNDNSSGLDNGLSIIAGHDVHNGSDNSTFIRFGTPNGTLCGRIRQTGSNSMAIANTSDIRLKENILPTQYGLSDILNIKVRDYNFKLDPVDNIKTGFLAQQLYEIFPTAVLVGGEDEKINPWMVDYSKLTPLLVKGIQDQQQIIETLQSEAQQQQAEIEQLKAQVNKINELEAKLEVLLNNQ